MEDLGRPGPHLEVFWGLGHDGDQNEAIGNRWADAMAKAGATMHETPEETSKEAKAIKKKQETVFRWIGTVGGLAAKDGTPKAEWPKPIGTLFINVTKIVMLILIVTYCYQINIFLRPRRVLVASFYGC